MQEKTTTKNKRGRPRKAPTKLVNFRIDKKLAEKFEKKYTDSRTKMFKEWLGGLGL